MFPTARVLCDAWAISSMKRIFQLMLAVSTAGTLAAEVTNIQLNEPFPSIVLPSVEDGSAMSVEQFRGQRLMLHVFASW